MVNKLATIIPRFSVVGGWQPCTPSIVSAIVTPQWIFVNIHVTALQKICDGLCINWLFAAKCNFLVRAKIAPRMQFVDFAFTPYVASTLYYPPSSKV